MMNHHDVFHAMTDTDTDNDNGGGGGELPHHHHHPLLPLAPIQYHHLHHQTTTPTLYIPIESPPTPAPSPGPHNNPTTTTTTTTTTATTATLMSSSTCPPPLTLTHHAHLLFPTTQDPILRRQILAHLLASCTPSELLFISTTIAPLLKRDFLLSLPPELSIHILSFLEDDPRTLVRASQVSRHWRRLVNDEGVWKRMCWLYGFTNADFLRYRSSSTRSTTPSSDTSTSAPSFSFSYRHHYKSSHITMTNWRHGGQLLQSHRVPVVSPDNGVVTSLALDADWVVVGLANSKIHIFSARTGVLARTLVGHEMGVWAVCLVSRGGYLEKGGVSEERESDGSATRRRKRERGLVRRAGDPVEGVRAGLERMGINNNGVSGSPPYQEQYVSPSLRVALGLSAGADASGSVEGGGGVEGWEEMAREKRSDNCYASQGWGQPNALVVSGGCDKVLRVWDIKTGYCIYILAGHTSTIRCIRVLHNRPIAVSGSRDGTVRVWDVQRGRPLRVLEGHQHSVRCLDVCGNKIVSGSYDTTCRLWDVDTGECLHVLRGHYHEIYSVAFDGVRIASGGLDTTVRVWDAHTGDCVALLQGHTALVCQLQLSPTILATGGSDGRVITFDLSKYSVLHRIAAHDSSVTSLQFDHTFLVTGGNDGRVRLYETATGNYVRELSEPSETVWKVAYGRGMCAVMCRRAGKTVMEIWSFRPK